jgi:hemerythrin HHE cation binding domain-containing protein
MSPCPADSMDGHVGDAESPFDVFAHCHTGLLAHMQDLERLPALIEGARLARRIAAETLQLFRSEVGEHHADEECALFPAVLAHAREGEERDRARMVIEHLVAEHRQVELAYARLEADLESIANGKDIALDVSAVAALAEYYQAHAVYEEAVFLPLAHQILDRDHQALVALRESLNSRVQVREMMRRLGQSG